MKNRFYDKNMHGADGRRQGNLQALLANVGDTEELHKLIMDIASSTHRTPASGADGRRRFLPTASRRAYPGFDFTPMNRAITSLHVFGGPRGSRIRQAQGGTTSWRSRRDFQTSDNVWRLLNLVTGRKFEFTVTTKPRRRRLEGSLDR